MSGKKHAFDAKQADQLLSLIRLGCFPLVAAETSGVPRRVFRDWLRRGERPRAREPFRTFAASVCEAIAHGRARAEMAVHEKDPKFWLKHGPGRDKPDNEGWTGEVKSGTRDQSAAAPAIEWLELASELLEALAPFPDARRLLAELVMRHEARAG